MTAEVEEYAIIFLNKEGIILSWNKGAEKIKGYLPQEIIGKSYKLFYSKEDNIKNLPDILLNEADKKGKANHEGWRIRKDGSRFWGTSP
jgi:PAS domain S-box-containing protein